MAKKDMMAAAGVCHSGRTKKDLGGIMGKVRDGLSDFGNKARNFLHLEEGGSAKREKRAVGGMMEAPKMISKPGLSLATSRIKRAMGGTVGSVKEEFREVNKTGGGKSINGALDREPLKRVKRAMGGVGKERKGQLY